jgi:GR25 family glycosyltransferase involved in LPS biosynthesis
MKEHRLLIFLYLLILFIILVIIIVFLIFRNNCKDNYQKTKINKIGYPILYINLNRSTDRKKYMEEHLKKYNIIDYKRISGVDGKKIYNMKEGEIDGIKFKNNYNIGSNYELACTLSHLKAIKYAYENNLSEVLIVEDDISLDLSEYWHDTLKNIVNKDAPKDWEILQLYISPNCIDKNEKKFIKRTNDECYGMVAYIINKKGMKQVLDKSLKENDFILGKFINNSIFPSRINSDYYIYKIIKNTYIYGFPTIIPNNEYLDSTIHPENTKNHIKAQKFYKNLYKNYK